MKGSYHLGAIETYIWNMYANIDFPFVILYNSRRIINQFPKFKSFKEMGKQDSR